MSQPATTPKKRALMPSTPLRSRLRGHGHALDAIVRIGKAGVTPAITTHLNKALFDHELVKLKLEAECPDDRYTVADQLAEQPGVNVVQILGRTILLYKRHPQQPRFEGKRAADADEARANKAGKPDKPGAGDRRTPPPRSRRRRT
jgi:RNA-binding protein